MSYQGWKNYETWSVALIVDNDEGLANYRAELVQQARKDNVDDEAPKGESGDDVIDRDAAISDLADTLKSWVTDDEEFWGPMPANPLYAQLLTGALSDVDWHELATNWIDEEG